MSDRNPVYPGASRREDRHQDREDANPRQAIRDRGRGRQLRLESERSSRESPRRQRNNRREY